MLWLDGATHLGLSILDGATHQDCRCLTVRHTPDCRCLMVRHTPAFGHPSPRGDGLPHRFDCQFDYQCIAAAPSPLGEGWPKAGVCRTIRSNCEAVNKNEGRGVSRRQANATRRFSFGPSGLFIVSRFLQWFRCAPPLPVILCPFRAKATTSVL